MERSEPVKQRPQDRRIGYHERHCPLHRCPDDDHLAIVINGRKVRFGDGDRTDRGNGNNTV